MNGIVFEIQVVLKGLMTARQKLDGHLAYNDFRFLYECVGYLGADFKQRLERASESRLFESDSAAGRSESAEVNQLEEALLANELFQEDARMKDAKIAELETEIIRLNSA